MLSRERIINWGNNVVGKAANNHLEMILDAWHVVKKLQHHRKEEAGEGGTRGTLVKDAMSNKRVYSPAFLKQHTLESHG